MRLAVLTAICLALAASRPAAGEGVIVNIREPEAAWREGAFGFLPFVVEAQSETATEIRLAGRADNGGEATVRLALPPGRRVRYEGFFPFADSYTLTWTAGTDGGRKYMPPPRGDYRPFAVDTPPPVVCVNGMLLRELRAAFKSAGAADEAYSLPADALPGRWQAYYGFGGLLVMDAGEARTLREPQREALARWVRWLGGRVWLVGKEAGEAASEMGLSSAASSRKCPALNGVVYLWDGFDAKAMLAEIPRGDAAAPLAASHDSGEPWRPLRRSLLDGLGGVARGTIVAVLAAFGLLMGPINYWYIRRRGNSLLFFVTTPILAVAGTGAILVAALLGEGTGGVAKRHAVLLRGDMGGEAMLFDIWGVRSGLYPPTLRFDPDTLALPLESRWNLGGYAVDLTDGVRLDRGWLRPRFSTAFLVVYPAVCRMDLEVTEEGGEYYLANGLGHAVERVAARLPDGGFGWAGDVPPGDRVRLRRDNSSDRLDEIVREAERFCGEGMLAARTDLAASCAGLPYLQDGGMTASVREGGYYYVRASSPREGGHE